MLRGVYLDCDVSSFVFCSDDIRARGKANVLISRVREKEKTNEENERLSNPSFESILLVLDCTYKVCRSRLHRTHRKSIFHELHMIAGGSLRSSTLGVQT